MLLNKSLDKILSYMKDNGIDLLLIGPSSDLEYLTGLNPLSDERFKALFILHDGRYFYVAPELYFEETKEALGEDTHIFTWSDKDGFLSAIYKADNEYGLSGKNIGINDGLRAVDIIDIEENINVNFKNACSIIENIRVIKTDDERENLRKAAKIADKVAEEILKYIKPGLREKDIKDKIEELMLKFGGQGRAFETIVASGQNSSKPHYNGDSRIIEKNDVIIMDFGCKYNGYCSDISRTVFVGEPTDEQKKIYSIVLEANKKGEASVREGVSAEEVDLAARNVIKSYGYGEYFINRTGHGIGIAVHEAPYIKEGNIKILKDGMAFSIEPGIYLPGRFGMRVEDIVLINDGKPEVLNKANKDIIIIK